MILRIFHFVNNLFQQVPLGIPLEKPQKLLSTLVFHDKIGRIRMVLKSERTDAPANRAVCP